AGPPTAAPPAPAGDREAMLRELAHARAEAARFRSLFDHHPDAAFALDPAGVLTAVNVACTELTGLPAARLVGTPFAELVDPDGRALTAARMAAVLAGAPHVWDVDILHANGRRSCTQVTAVPMVVDGAVRGVHGIARDITIHRVMEEQLTHQAFHDALTGLANRVLFRERAERSLLRAARARAGDGPPEHVAVLFLDLDDFKAVNDSLGHAEGDRLLESVAARLLKVTRGCDTVARLGGDEFAVLLDGMAGPDDAAAVVQRITAAVRVPVALEARELTVTCSVGLAHARDGDTADELLRNADVAMYRAKAAGKGRHAVFEPAMHAAVVARIQLEADLRRALARGELSLVYQPLVELDGGRLTGLEALVRWRHPARGLVAPGQFIPLAEETGLVVELGRWVLRAACAQLAAWDAALGAGAAPGVSVNVSGRQLDDPAFVGDVAAALADAALAPGRLTLEVTESVLMREPDVTLARLHALKALGVSLAVDDFGTGYSSLSYLQRFPVDALKIDKSFVDGVARGGSDAALARTIIALAEMLRIRSVAEGIEREDQRAQLAALGCQVGQGYLFARPLAPDEVVSAVAPAAAGRRPHSRV
ncbi:MAG: diguanylate cyclase/phosphodiesterase (GGDEF & EAL domains) with PAS/PAC sensor(s), partial [uncultured Gemmatimonadaceae bacterium]